jgi:predicted 3-demethylubiquinone-9 3-methyltransferase (glyoxalase superfamily)
MNKGIEMEYLFDHDVKFVIARRFHSEMEANIYASKLRRAEISCFISNSAMSTMLPFNDGFTLHVPIKDLREARRILKRIDNEVKNFEEDFRDADHEDIQYQKELYQETYLGRYSWQIILFTILAVLLLIVFRFFAARLGLDILQI